MVDALQQGGANPVLHGQIQAGFSILQLVNVFLPGRTQNLAGIRPWRTGFAKERAN